MPIYLSEQWYEPSHSISEETWSYDYLKKNTFSTTQSTVLLMEIFIEEINTTSW